MKLLQKFDTRFFFETQCRNVFSCCLNSPLLTSCRNGNSRLFHICGQQRSSGRPISRCHSYGYNKQHSVPVPLTLQWIWVHTVDLQGAIKDKLPVQRQVEFKIACIVHQSLASLAPTYLTTDIHLVSEYGRRPLRSSTDRTLTVPRTHNRCGDRSFAVAGPRLWNSLPISLRQISSYGQFRRYLKKNHLFGIWEITAQCDA